MKSIVKLQSAHLFLDNKLADQVFGNVPYAYATFTQNHLLVTPVSSIWFAKMYDATQFMLKTKNGKGDKTVGIKELLIENDLDMEDRILDFEVIEKTKLIKIAMH